MRIEMLLSPSGRLRIDAAMKDDEYGWDAPETISQLLADGFAVGNGAGLLALIREELPTLAPASFRYCRQIARELITRLCRVQSNDGDELAALLRECLPDQASLDALVQAAPPMRGAEYISSDWLLSLHEDLTVWVLDHYKPGCGPFAEWIRKLNPAWKSVGKVSFHLAENKQDQSGTYPFAFLATFIHRLSENDVPRHLPLGTAVKTYVNDRNALLALLKPIQEAAKRSKLIAELLEKREIYRPQAWTARQAFDFLSELPAIEESGVIVRIPNIWKSNSPPKVQVSVAIDLRKGQQLGVSALLDFSVQAVLDGQALSPEELAALLNSQDGLLRIRGNWVAADPDKIRELLQQWDQAARSNQQGMNFIDGLRLLAGARLPGTAHQSAEASEFSDVHATGRLKQLLTELASPAAIALPPLPTPLQDSLRPYQLDGVRWLWRMSELGLGACLADDMGLGKTLQVLCLLTLLQARDETRHAPALLVVPASLLQNWCKESARFTPHLRFGILHPMAMSDDDSNAFASNAQQYVQRYDAVLTTYGMLSRVGSLQTITWAAVIADEAQAIKNPAAKQSKAVRSLRSPRRLALTGTPVENRLSDLWSIFDFISPGLLGTPTSFKAFVKQLNDDAGNANYAPLRRLTKPYILRRLKTDKRIIADLPDKTEMKVFCQLTKPQAVLYQQAVATMSKELQENDSNQRRGLIFKYLMIFKQICNHPSHFTGNGDYDAAAGGKFLRLTEIAEEIRSRQEKVLVFTQFAEMTEPLHEHLSRCFGRSGLILHGGTPIKQRQRLVEDFQQDAGPPFFVLSVKAAGTGLNLTAASHVVHFDRWWNPAVENQATDRAYRIGQHRNVLAHKFICRGTVEEKIDALIDEKKDLADSLLSQGAEKLLTDMNNAELLKFVELDLKSTL
jgi:superfamily II DNA or RNA helicase